MNNRSQIVIILFFLSISECYAQSNSLLLDNRIKMDFNLLIKMNQARLDDFRFVSSSLSAVPLVAIFPVGEENWGSEVYNYEHESRVLLFNEQKKIRFWSIDYPKMDPSIEWFEKDGFYSRRYLLFNTDVEDKLQSMISFVGANQQLYFVYFFPSEVYTRLPVIGYVEEGKDIFVDTHLRKHNLQSILKSRYGSVDRYRELYENYKRMISYDPKGCPMGNSVRLISNKDAAKEIATCVEDYKFKCIWAHNVEDTLSLQSGKNTSVVTYYDGKHIIYWDMGRDEQKLGDLEDMDDYCFEAVDFADIYDNGNCNE